MYSPDLLSSCSRVSKDEMPEQPSPLKTVAEAAKIDVFDISTYSKVIVAYKLKSVSEFEAPSDAVLVTSLSLNVERTPFPHRQERI